MYYNEFIHVKTENIDISWDLKRRGVSSNPNFDMEIDQMQLYAPWDWEELSWNSFYKKYIIQIQRWARRIIGRRRCRVQCRLIHLYLSKFGMGRRNMIISLL